ncbi:class I adenylate-forming enzyme family protein [Parendozoicomonas haliclonae]|nr:class I adenylate-forming enzyme family protein [Parendozoicomonas haliclonae]
MLKIAPALLLVAASHLFAGTDWEQTPWFEHFPPSIQAKLKANPDLDLTDKSILKLWDDYFDASDAESRIAVSGLKKSLTIRQLDEESRDLAAYLQARLQGQKHRVAVMMPSSPELMVVLLGVIRAGYVPVIVLTAGDNDLLTQKLKKQLQLSKPSAMIGMATHSKVIQDALEGAQQEDNPDGDSYTSMPLIVSGLFDTDQTTGLVAGATRWLRSTGASWTGITQSLPAGAVTLKSAIQEGSDKQVAKVRMGLDDEALVQFTSGTTGNPKAISITQKNLLANLEQVGDVLRFQMEGAPPQPSLWMPLPMTHAFGLMIAMGAMPLLKGSLQLVTDPRNPEELFSTLGSSKPDALFGVDKLLAGITGEKGQPKTLNAMGDKKPTMIVAGASAIKQTTRDSVKATLGVDITEGYGMSESTVGIALEMKPGQGLVPLPYIDVRIAKIPEDELLQEEQFDLNNYEVQSGDEGELFVSGDNICGGYDQCPEETAKTFVTDSNRVRWIRTGDNAAFNPNGTLRITARAKEIIVVNGQNVNPEKLESIAAQMGDIEETMAFGVPKDPAYPAGDERVALIVRPKVRANVSSIDVVNFLNTSKRLETYETPLSELVHIVPHDAVLPRNPLTKPLRTFLKREALSQLRSTYGSQSQELQPKDITGIFAAMSLKPGK